MLRTSAHSPSYFALSRGSSPEQQDLVDFCIPCNPYFPTPEMFYNLAKELETILKYYPSDADTISSELCETLGFNPQTVAMGNGSTELITWIDHLLVRESLATPIPTFGRWTDQPLETGKRVDMFPLQESQDFALDLKAFVNFVKQRQSRVAVICNPNNPDGGYIPRKRMIALLDSLIGLDLVVVDESFIDFVDAEPYPSVASEAATRPNVVVLKSLGKNFGLHGIRFGYLVANPALASAIRKILPKWNLNSFAEVFIFLLKRHKADYNKSLHLLARDRRMMYQQLSELPGLKVFPSQGNFILVKLPDGKDGGQLRDYLLSEHRVFIRECGNKLGATSQLVRLVVRPQEDVQRLLAGISAFLYNTTLPRQQGAPGVSGRPARGLPPAYTNGAAGIDGAGYNGANGGDGRQLPAGAGLAPVARMPEQDPYAGGRAPIPELAPQELGGPFGGPGSYEALYGRGTPPGAANGMGNGMPAGMGNGMGAGGVDRDRLAAITGQAPVADPGAAPAVGRMPEPNPYGGRVPIPELAPQELRGADGEPDLYESLYGPANGRGNGRGSGAGDPRGGQGAGPNPPGQGMGTGPFAGIDPGAGPNPSGQGMGTGPFAGIDPGMAGQGMGTGSFAGVDPGMAGGGAPMTGPVGPMTGPSAPNSGPPSGPMTGPINAIGPSVGNGMTGGNGYTVGSMPDVGNGFGESPTVGNGLSDGIRLDAGPGAPAGPMTGPGVPAAGYGNGEGYGQMGSLGDLERLTATLLGQAQAQSQGQAPGPMPGQLPAPAAGQMPGTDLDGALPVIGRLPAPEPKPAPEPYARPVPIPELAPAELDEPDPALNIPEDVLGVQAEPANGGGPATNPGRAGRGSIRGDVRGGSRNSRGGKRKGKGKRPSVPGTNEFPAIQVTPEQDDVPPRPRQRQRPARRSGPPSGPMPMVDAGPPQGPTGIPTSGPPSGSFPAQGPPSGSFPAQGPQTGSFPAQGPQTGSFPAQGPRSGQFPIPELAPEDMGGPPSGFGASAVPEPPAKAPGQGSQIRGNGNERRKPKRKRPSVPGTNEFPAIRLSDLEGGADYQMFDE